MALGAVLAPLNSSMIVVALPRIMDGFGVTVAAVGWLVTAYLITMASLQPVAGKLGDRLGRRRLILGGLFAFGLVSLGAAASTSFVPLLFFRVQQAVTGAIVLPNGMALLRQVVPERRRGGRFGLVGGAIALAAALGPPLGGLLVTVLGWRAIFTVNVFIVAPALVLGWRAIPRDGGGTRGDAGFDLRGALLFSALLVVLALLLTQSGEGLAPSYLLLGGLGLLGGGVLFVGHERRHADPLFQFHLFRRRAFAAANGAIATGNLAMYSVLVALPLMLSPLPAWNDSKIGLLLAVLSGTMVLVAPLGGRLADRWGRRKPAVAGLALFTVGLILLALGWRAETISFAALAPGLSLAGAGLGLSNPGLQTAVVEAVSAQEAGVAAGIFSTSRYLGSIVGTSLLAAALEPAAGVGWVFTMVVGTAVMATLLSTGLRDRPAAR